MSDDSIPAFLRIPQSERNAAWRDMPVAARPRKEAWARPRPPRGWPADMPVPKTITPEAIALAREIDRRTKAKRDARFAALRARKTP